MLTASRPGPFHDDTALYLDDHGLREVKLEVRGTAVQPAGSPQREEQPADRK